MTRDDTSGWVVSRHADVVRVLADHETFSNQVSHHLSVPNGMDPPEHTRFRRVVEQYFSGERVAAFEPRCRTLAARLARSLSCDTPVELMSAFARPFAGEVQCAFLGWPATLAPVLNDWAAENRQAIRDGDRARLGELARGFDTQVRAQLEARRGCAPEADVTASLMHERVDGRPLRDEEIVSILRNWTVGEVGTIAAAVGILVYHLAADRGLQQHLRSDPGWLPATIDEILRVDGPLPANRRVTTCPVELGGRSLDEGEPLSLSWIAANRDPAVFEQPHEIRPDRDSADNLLYGAGIHVCPGAPLARLELRVALEELLGATRAIELTSSGRATRAGWPAAGFDDLPLRVSAT